MKESKEMMKKEVSFMKKKGAPKSMIKHEEAEMKEKYMDGGRTMLSPRTVARAAQQAAARRALPAIAAGIRPYKKGGSVAPSKMGAVKTAAPSRDGVAVKGKTKGKMVKMMRGGKAC